MNQESVKPDYTSIWNVLLEVEEKKLIILATGKVNYVGKNKIGRDVIKFEADSIYSYNCLMEIRNGRKQLAFATLYKRKPPTI